MSEIVNETWSCETGLPFNTVAAGSTPAVFSACTDGPVDGEDRTLWDDATRRLVACANVCRGIPTELLESAAREGTSDLGRFLTLRALATGAAEAARRQSVYPEGVAGGTSAV